MARDEHLLESLLGQPAALRTYAWTPPTISLGYFQRSAALARLPPEMARLPVVRRLTGGGAILHDQEVTYGLVLDDSVPAARAAPVALYRLVHECWRRALARHGCEVVMAPDSFPLPTPRTGPFFCFEKPGRTDLMIAGRKLLGSAQRRTARRVLQHGSLLLARRYAGHPGADLDAPAADTVAKWIDAFVEALGGALDLAIQPDEWTAEALADVAQRRERYVDTAWTRRL
jgi:lipoate-protein ligase A